MTEHLRATAAGDGEGMVGLKMQQLASRMHGFELLVGPYAVAHYRLHHALNPPEAKTNLPLPRLGVYLADTLGEPDAAAAGGALGFVAKGIEDEHDAANEVKTRQPVLAIIGNPPYRRLEENEDETLLGQWMNGVWDDLKAPVRDAGKGNQLNTFPELSVAFWRWAIWKLFEAENAPERGVMAYITNRKFLTGWPYAGLRKTMRERFDRIDIIDLRGDVRRGARAGAKGDQGVFNIQVGTAITVCVADGSRAGEPALVHYHDSWSDMLLSRDAKLAWLDAKAADGRVDGTVALGRDLLDDFRPRPFDDGRLLSLDECFGFKWSGVETKRDRLVYGYSAKEVERKVESFRGADPKQAQELFGSVAGTRWSVAQSLPLDLDAIRRSAYRPLDNRWRYDRREFNDRPRPELRRVWGQENVCLFAMPNGTNDGPAVWCHALLPDRHAFRGSYDGYAFPLFDRRQAGDTPNLSPALLEGLEDAYGTAPDPADVFDAILCLLSASSYTTRFAADLEDVFPHVPFPATRALFDEAVALGRDIRAMETFARKPDLPAGFCSLDTMPTGPLEAGEWTAEHGGSVALCADGSGLLAGMPERVWRFAVSGYRVLPRWLDARRGTKIDAAAAGDIRDNCGRIEALIALFGEADKVLERTLADALDREAIV